MKLILAILMLGHYADTSKVKTITIIGEAFNLKQGAFVITKENITYEILGVRYWSKDYDGKQIKVTGELEIYEVNIDSQKPIIQEVSGIKRVIKNAKWYLVNTKKKKNN
jgi:hypothetical protein